MFVGKFCLYCLYVYFFIVVLINLTETLNHTHTKLHIIGIYTILVEAFVSVV